MALLRAAAGRMRARALGAAAEPMFELGDRCRQYSSYPAAESTAATRPKVTLTDIRKMYRKKEPISVLTAHDYPSALMADRAGVDITLVGDSLAMVALGYEDTNQLSLDEMLYHCRAVQRGNKSAFLVGDMPFGTYETSVRDAIASSVRLIGEGRMEAVKLEGGREMSETIRAITRAGIPVLGHIGLTPQRQASLGGFRVQGKTVKSATELLDNAYALQDAGVFGMVIEAVPEEVARIVTERISVPTIGIGAGAGCSGQVLVQLDMLGNFDRFTPKFLKKYENNLERITAGIRTYVGEVKAGTFPAAEHTYTVAETQLAAIKQALAEIK
ncbi:3-methyl-2-oxobutanoate hydroxymethyltransferase [Dipodascopsis tothii]|uniref:3-methyl-2-oxobutanoate hydroxymethyltransferase n=1 Tax=Dipodascopsis tothii TaxID=44089 RepID=UPI0034CD1318